jgi:protein-S-isoprenylcysteine O-methyltransferase Ste14
MNRDHIVGMLLLVAGVVGIVAYAALLYFYSLLVLAMTGFIAIAAILGILAWVGWTMATAVVEPTKQSSTNENSQK